jgi:hypothetical protein
MECVNSSPADLAFCQPLSEALKSCKMSYGL